MRPALPQHVAMGIVVTSALLCRFADADRVCGAGAHARAWLGLLPAWLYALLSPPYPWLGCPMQLNKFPVPSSPLAGLPRANLLRPQRLPGGKEW